MIKINVQLAVFFACIIFSINAASLEKRSPFLRLDELSNRIYSAKNKLGAGIVDPFEMYLLSILCLTIVC